MKIIIEFLYKVAKNTTKKAQITNFAVTNKAITVTTVTTVTSDIDKKNEETKREITVILIKQYFMMGVTGMTGDFMKESELIRKISEYLKSIPDLFFWKEHGGMYGTAGIPDLIICYRGRFIGLECKVGKNDATVLQSLTIRRILRAGGYAIVVRSVEEVKQLISAFKQE